MSTIIGNKPIKVIQGATKDIRRKFDTEVTQNIASVVISCNELGLNFTLDKTENGEFTHRLSSSLTATFAPQTTTYDMTVTYTDGSVGIETGIPFVVEERINPIGGNI